ncbi:MAG: NUDIX hydrolase [Planctomycetaceae bacterium]|nr:NUDIX hydrolase [Planctomycetaceae bacterium]
MVYNHSHERQAAAIPVRNGKICLVTSSSGRHWIIPKGHVPTGTTPAVLAACEAWEEAGLLGSVAGSPCCTYCFEKAGREYQVEVYLLEVARCVSDWPERRLRQRRWLPVAEAIQEIQPAALRDALMQLVEQGVVISATPPSRAA